MPYSGLWSELGSTKDKGSPPFSFLNFLFAFSVCFRNLRLHCKASLHSLVWTSRGVIKTGNPYPSLAPPCHLGLWSAILPSQTWHSCVLETWIHSKQAACIIMWIFGKTSFLLLDTHAPKLACLRLCEREWKFTISSDILRETLKGDAMILVFCWFPCCRLFCIFIESTILHWISQGVIKVHDMIGVCSPPHVVLPLTVEPTKPRLGHDECFLNLWTRDLPFKLDHLPDLPHYVLLGHFQTFDHNNGYQHLKIHPDSQEFFRFSWRGYFSPFLDGKQVPFYITTLALLLPPLRLLWVYLYHSISMIDMWASYSHPTGLVTCLGDRNITSLLRYSRTPLRRPGEQFW